MPRWTWSYFWQQTVDQDSCPVWNILVHLAGGGRHKRLCLKHLTWWQLFSPNSSGNSGNRGVWMMMTCWVHDCWSANRLTISVIFWLHILLVILSNLAKQNLFEAKDLFCATALQRWSQIYWMCHLNHYFRPSDMHHAERLSLDTTALGSYEPNLPGTHAALHSSWIFWVAECSGCPRAGKMFIKCPDSFRSPFLRPLLGCVCVVFMIRSERSLVNCVKHL